MASTALRLARPALFICDQQEKFRHAIYGFDHILKIASKMLQASRILNIPIYVTTQNKKALGEICSELDVSNAKLKFDKTYFSMHTQELEKALPSKSNVAITGIESHVCVLQTTLDLLARGHQVYVIADAVSSCNREEIPIAIERMRQAGAKISTSESFLYELMGDSSIPEFKQIVKLVKETKDATRDSLQALNFGSKI